MVEKPLQNILDHLFPTYGGVEDSEVHDIERKLCEQTYDIVKPLIVIFNEVEELQQMVKASKRSTPIETL